jgi:hypothetical protein
MDCDAASLEHVGLPITAAHANTRPQYLSLRLMSDRFVVFISTAS